MASEADYFGDRHWRVATEVTGTQVAEPGTDLNAGTGPVTVKFDTGSFEIEGGCFHSPFSSARGHKGVLLQEVDEHGEDVAGSRIAVGGVVFARARKSGACCGLF